MAGKRHGLYGAIASNRLVPAKQNTGLAKLNHGGKIFLGNIHGKHFYPTHILADRKGRIFVRISAHHKVPERIHESEFAGSSPEPVAVSLTEKQKAERKIPLKIARKLNQDVIPVKSVSIIKGYSGDLFSFFNRSRFFAWIGSNNEIMHLGYLPKAPEPGGMFIDVVLTHDIDVAKGVFVRRQEIQKSHLELFDVVKNYIKSVEIH